MALELVTGYWGQQHVTAEQDADLNAGIIGREPCILRVGENMRAEAVTANKVRIFDGIFVGYGRVCAIDEGAYEDVEIENGTAGLLRNDMIVIKYVKDEATGIEGVRLAVLKGQTGSTATDPTPNNQDIRAGAFESEMPLYRVRLNGLAIEAVERICEMPRTIKDLTSLFGQLNSNLNAANFNLINSTYYPVTNVIVSGRTMQLHCAGLLDKDVPADAELVIGTLPETYRPPYKIIKYGLCSASTNRLLRLSIDVDGKVTYALTADTAKGVGVNINETFVARSK